MTSSASTQPAVRFATARFPVSLDLARCHNCLKCVDACPTGVFQVSDGDAQVALAHPSDCHVCFLCVPDCPTGAITVTWDALNPRLQSVYDELDIALDGAPDATLGAVEPQEP